MRLTREQKKEKMIVDIVNKMFEIAGHDITYDDIKERKDAWYSEWTMTTQQSEEWIEWGVVYLKKLFRMNEVRAKKDMLWINLQWGLKYSDYNPSKVSDSEMEKEQRGYTKEGAIKQLANG